MINPIEELRKRAFKLRLNQGGLADAIGVSAAYISMVMTGKKPPSTTVLQYLGLKETKVRRYERIDAKPAGSLGKDRGRSARTGNSG